VKVELAKVERGIRADSVVNSWGGLRVVKKKREKFVLVNAPCRGFEAKKKEGQLGSVGE